MEWDLVTKEAWLHEDVSAQLAAAQQREAEARRDVEIHGMFQDLSARVRKERDKLLQKDTDANQ